MPIGVQEADVWAAADALLLAGEQPTVERVRLHLGRGSPNTVGPHLKAWFRGLGERVLSPHKDPSDLPASVKQAVTDLWAFALDTARQEWKQAAALERETLEKERSTLHSSEQALIAERDRVHAREADLEAAVQIARAQAEAAEERLKTAELSLKQKDDAVADAGQQLQQFQSDIARLHGEARVLRTHHEEALSSLEARHAVHERRWLSEIDEHRQSIKRVQSELDKARKVMEHHTVQHDETVRRLQSACEEQTKLAAQSTSTATALKMQLDAKTNALQTAQTQWSDNAAQTTQQLALLRDQLAAKDRQIEILATMVGKREKAAKPR